MSVHTVTIDASLRVRLTGLAVRGVALDGARKSPALRRMVQRDGPPELASDRPLGPGVDLFGLGALIFELLHGGSVPGGASKLVGRGFEAKLGASTPDPLRVLLSRLLAPTPEERGVAGEAIEALEQVAPRGPAAREALALALSIEPGTEPEREAEPELPEGVPPVGFPLDQVTKETDVGDALARMAPGHADAPTPSDGTPVDDDTIPPPAHPRFFEEGPTVLEHGPKGVGGRTLLDDLMPPMEGDAGSGFAVADATVVERGGGTEILPDPSGGIAPPVLGERTVQLDLADVPSRGDRPSVEVPVVHVPETGSPLEPVKKWLLEKQQVEVGGWPLPWIVGIGLGAMFLVVFTMMLVVLIAG